MRLRQYLVRRGLQTIITLVVFLVILFAIFRLMPGDPTRLFTVPGQPEEARDEICVSFGLCKQIPQEGNAFETGFSTGVPGAYALHIWLNDSSGNSNLTYFSHTNPKLFFGSPIKIFISTDRDSWSYRPGEQMEVTANVTTPSPTPSAASVWSELYDEMGNLLPSSNKTMTWVGSGDDFTVDYTVPSTPGAYLVKVIAIEAPNFAETTAGFSVNQWLPGSPGNIGPFQLVEGKFQSSQQSSGARMSVAVISSKGSIPSLNGYIRNPPPVLSITYITAIHPDMVVRRSILEQFGSYFVDMITLNLGRSFLTGKSITDEISVRIGPTLLLFGSAMMVNYLIGILIGAVIAWRRGSKLELGVIVTTLFFYAMPVFWLGIVLLWLFQYNLGWAPLGGMGGFDLANRRPYEGFDYVKDVAWHLALPLTTLVMIGMAGSILLMRSNMLEVMGEDYITTAKAKGLTERGVIYKHAARNALLPVVTAIAISIGFIISGGVLTETVFSWPGMGSYLVSRTLAQDFPAVQGAFLILAIMTIISNMFADVLYAYLDPRVRL